MKRLAGLSALALIISSTSGCGWLWGEDGYSGPKHSLVKSVVETFKDDQTMLAQMLAA